MNISGIITIFPEKRKDSKGENYVICRGTISSKDESGEYLNKSVEVHFKKEVVNKETLLKLEETKCYTLEVKEGFLVVDAYNKQDGKQVRQIGLLVTKGRLTGSKEVERKPEEVKNDDLPF